MSDADQELFLALGLPKSGTTLLQRLLDAHPLVFCRGEHNLDYLQGRIGAIMPDYNRMLALADRRTVREGAVQVDAAAWMDIFAFAAGRIARATSAGEPLVGISDNTMVDKLHALGAALGGPKIVVIFRNPVDVAVSAWHHNNRLAGEEDDASHRDRMAAHGGLDGWALRMAREFHAAVNRYRGYLENHGNAMHVTYEALVADRAGEAARICRFLGVYADDATTAAMAAATDFGAMREASRNPAFFRSGRAAFGEGAGIGRDTRETIVRLCAPSLGFLDLDPERILAVG
jgi:hypothetical protein